MMQLMKCVSMVVLAGAVSPHLSYGQSGWFEDFENGTSPFGFEMLDRGGDLGLTSELLTVQGTEGFLNSTSVFLGESWDQVSRDIGIREGIVSVWFHDTGYTGPNANDIRLCSEEKGSLEGWPQDYVTVELKGERTGHGGGEINYYYVTRPAPGLNAMNIFFGTDIETGEYIERRKNSWNQVSFVIDDAITYTSVNNNHSDCLVDSPLTKLELLCRSGWYFTRGGDPKIMIWDDICVMPKIASTSFDHIPSWLSQTGGSPLIESASPDADFIFLPNTEKAIRIPDPETTLTASWNVQQGEIELWFWDPYLTEPGYKTEIGIQNAMNPDEYIVVKAYSVVMNAVSESYYCSTHNSGHGGSFSIPRTKGWHKVSFRKVKNTLRHAVDGNMADGENLVWENPPSSLELFIRSGSSSYVNGSGIWLSRIMMAGQKNTPVSEWKEY